MEVLMHRHCHVVANAEDSAKCIGAQAHVSVLTHKFKGLSLLLHRVFSVTSAVNYDFSCLNFSSLTSTLTFYECTCYSKASTCCYLLQQLFVKLVNIGNNLHIVNGRTVVKSDKIHRLTTTFCSHPPLYGYFRTEVGRTKYINNFCSHTIISK